MRNKNKFINFCISPSMKCLYLEKKENDGGPLKVEDSFRII